MTEYGVSATGGAVTALRKEPAPAAALRVEICERVARNVMALTLTDPAGRRLPPWTPGSHIDLILPNGKSRQYSLCGDRWNTYQYRIAILDGGRIIAEGTLAELKQLFPPTTVEYVEKQPTLEDIFLAIVGRDGAVT